MPPELDARPLDGAVRALAGRSWAEARRLVETGKIRVGGEVVTDAARRVRAGDLIELAFSAPRPRTARLLALEADRIAFVDAAVVVVRKPPGVSTVPYGDEGPEAERETLDALVRDLLARRDSIRGRAPLGVVQRLDKETSGLLVFARSVVAKKHLGQQLRRRSMHRRYLAIAHGRLDRARTIRSVLVADRGDRLRGSTDRPGAAGGRVAVTHVEPVEELVGATLVACRLETGRTHQIRIHLAEAGHPLVGERVYVRDYEGPRIAAPRLMLHAAELGFDHPLTGERMTFREPLPEDFAAVLERLRSR